MYAPSKTIDVLLCSPEIARAREKSTIPPPGRPSPISRHRHDAPFPMIRSSANPSTNHRRKASLVRTSASGAPSIGRGTKYKASAPHSKENRTTASSTCLSPTSTVSAISTAADVTARALSPNHRCRVIEPIACWTNVFARFSSGVMNLSAYGRQPLRGPLEPEPVERVRPEGQEVRKVANMREANLADQLHGLPAVPFGQIDLRRLHESAQVHHAEDRFILILAYVHQDLLVLRVQESDRAPAQRLVALANSDHPLHPVQQGGRNPGLGLHIDAHVAIHRSHDHR